VCVGRGIRESAGCAYGYAGASLGRESLGLALVMRRGDQYVESLRDGRAVFLDGERVPDVTKHPAFAEPIKRIADRYDVARSAEAQAITTCLDPSTGSRFGAMWLIPRSAEDLEIRRGVQRFWAEGSYGLMGRTPDHVACVLTAFASGSEFFARGGTRF